LGTLVKSENDTVSVKYLITCAGLYSDHVAKQANGKDYPVIVPFLGQYFTLKPEHTHTVKGLIYPVPNPAFPFLGVHFTRRTNGEVWLGPNAMLSTSREGYKLADFSLMETLENFSHLGFLKFMGRLLKAHRNFLMDELARGLNVSAFVKQLQPYMPTLTPEHIQPDYKPSGVRAMAVNEDGSILEDFNFDVVEGRHILHVRNAPSPAATSSLAIAKEVVEKASAAFGIPITK